MYDIEQLYDIEQVYDIKQIYDIERECAFIVVTNWFSFLSWYTKLMIKN